MMNKAFPVRKIRMLQNVPVNHMDLVYTGKPQVLVEPGLVELGIAENDAILNAVHTER